MKRKILTLVIAFIFTLTQMSFLSGVKAKAETSGFSAEVVVLGYDKELKRGITSKTSAYEALEEVAEKENIVSQDSQYGKFITGICGVEPKAPHGWYYIIYRNGKYQEANVGIDQYNLQNGDKLIVYYMEYGKTLVANKIDFSNKLPNKKTEITVSNVSLDWQTGEDVITPIKGIKAKIDGKEVQMVENKIILENGLSEGKHSLELSDWVNQGEVPKVVADRFEFDFKNPTASVRVEGINGTIVEGTATGSNALEIVEAVLNKNNIDYKVTTSSFGSYISSIAGLSAGKFGGYDGWLFYVKNSGMIISPNLGIDSYIPDNGDNIVVYYGEYTTPYVNNIVFKPLKGSIVKENEEFKMTFSYKSTYWYQDGSGNWLSSNTETFIKNAIVNIDNQNYITDINGEIDIKGISMGTHTYKISGYNIDKLPTVIMDKGVFTIDNTHNPSMDYSDSRFDEEYNKDNSIIKKDIDKEINSTLNYIKSNSKDSWAAISLNKFGLKADEDFIKNSAVEIKTYGIKDYLNTDIEKLIIALTANGYTPYDFMGYNLVSELFNRNIDDFLINDAMFGLIAYKYSNIDENYKVSREKLVDYILSKAIKYKSGENEIFGWALSGDKINPDITGGVINALSEYYDSRSDVKSAVDKAVKSLSLLQTQSGYLADNYGMFSESLSFTILGLTSIGVNPEGVDFTKIKGDLVSGLLSFKGTDGQFRHAIDGGNNYIATEQALRALIAVKEYKKLGKYDFFKSGIVSKNLAVYDLKIENTISDKSVTVKNNKSQINHLQDALERIVSQVADKENQIVGNAENNVLKTAQEATVNNTIRVDESKVANKNLNIKTVVIGSGMALAGLALIIYLLRNKKEAMK